jgi:hypothetical protein
MIVSTSMLAFVREDELALALSRLRSGLRG